MDHLVQHIESLIFTAESPISFAEIKACLQESFDTKFKKPALTKAIGQLIEKYQQEDFSFELVEIAGGYQFLTKASYHTTVGVYLKQTTKKRLSRAALETLSIIAYKQPVAKSEMEKIRGVSCDYSVQKLLEKELVAIVGRSEGPGKPLLYGTSEKFMDYFGLKSITDLPKPKDFKEPDNEIGEKAPIDEDAPLAKIQSNSPAEEIPNQPSATNEAPSASEDTSENARQDVEALPIEVLKEEVQGEATQLKEETNTAENENETGLDVNDDKIVDIEELASDLKPEVLEELQEERNQPKKESTRENGETTNINVDDSEAGVEVTSVEIQDSEKVDAVEETTSEAIGQQSIDNTEADFIEEPDSVSEEIPQEKVTDIEALEQPSDAEEILDEDI